MTTQIRTTGALFTGVLLMSAALPGTAFAVDGQIAITQAKAMAGGVTPGDAPGFPVTISQPGSYVLSGNLTVPDANTDAIVIEASHVTVDLNGFAILGPTDCSGGLNPCAGAGNGTGIGTPTVQFNITIRNGTVQGMGGRGILLQGDSHLVEYVHARSNGLGGIGVVSSQDVGGSIVQYNTVQRNGPLFFSSFPVPRGFGIYVGRGIASHNVADVNYLGILVQAGTASYNVSTRNAGGGLVLGDKASYIGNTMIDNTGLDGDVPSGGHNLGQNLCSNAVCPGAQF
jgi:hypothetical protein